MDTNSHRNLQGLQRVKKGEREASGKLSHSQLKSIERLTTISVDFGLYPKQQKKKKMQQEQGE